MCKACGLPVSGLGTESVLSFGFPQSQFMHFKQYMENSGFIQYLHNFYTQSFTTIYAIFQSVISSFYTVCTHLIITITIYTK